jgi:LuxR family maltose regulon positive regulatory protein
MPPKSERPKPSPLSELTARECEVLKLLCENMSNKEIAIALGLSIVTVKSHLKKIYIKLGVSSKAEAIRIFHNVSK